MTLADYIAKKGIARAEFARQLGVSPSYVSMLCAGSFFPGRRLMLRILKATQGKVTPNDLIGVDLSVYRVKKIAPTKQERGHHAENRKAGRKRQGSREGSPRPFL